MTGSSTQGIKAVLHPVSYLGAAKVVYAACSAYTAADRRALLRLLRGRAPGSSALSKRAYREPISLKDVVKAVGLSAGHLTTVVGRKTGRTVLEWTTERRMAGARRLLVETDLAAQEAGPREGHGDAGCFARTFRRAHGATPPGWRRAGRPS